MKRNIGIADRAIRLIIAVAIGCLYYFKIIEGTPGSALLIVAGIFLATGLLGFSPLYSFFGFTSCSLKNFRQKSQINSPTD